MQVGNEIFGAPYFSLIPASFSCKDIKATHPNSQTGYNIMVGNETRILYCNMNVLCGLGGGGWTCIAIESSGNCAFSGYYHHRFDSDIGSCTQITFPTYDKIYRDMR